MTTHFAETKTAASSIPVTVISIWSKIEGLEGRLMGRENNVTYTVRVLLGSTPEETLSNAFAATNADDRPMGQKACSTSSGDILVLDGRHYLVQPFGFKRLTLLESEKIQALTSRDTSFGYDFLVKIGKL